MNLGHTKNCAIFGGHRVRLRYLCMWVGYVAYFFCMHGRFKDFRMRASGGMHNFKWHILMCSVCVEQRMICRWTSEAHVLDLLKQSVGLCCQPSTEVPGLTKKSKRNMPAWSRHVSGQEASATDAELWCLLSRWPHLTSPVTENPSLFRVISGYFLDIK